MLVGGNKKRQKSEKTKFRKHQQDDYFSGYEKEKPKHHDKSYYRLVKQEERELYDV